MIGPKSKTGIKKLRTALDDETNGLPEIVRDTARMYLEHIDMLATRISAMVGSFVSMATNGSSVTRKTLMSDIKRPR